MATPSPPRRHRPPLPPRKHRPLPRGPQVSTGRRRLAVLLAPLLLVLLGAVALRIAYTDRALPGVQLGGTNVEGDARSALRERMNRFKAEPVTIFAAGKTLRVTPAAAGYELDVEATVEKVIDEGRDGPLGGVVSAARGLFETRDVQPVARVDDVRLEATVRSFARLVNRNAYPGGVSVSPSTLDVTVQGPRQGRTVERARLQAQLVAALRGGRQQLRAPFTSAKVATLEQVQDVGRAAEAYLDQSLTLTGAGDPIVLTAERVAPILRLRSAKADRTEVRLGSDEAALTALVDGIAADRDRPARPAQLEAPGRIAVLDGKGEESWRPRRASVRVTREARSGRKIRRAAAVEVIATAVRTGEHRVRLPVQTDKPSVTAKAAAAVDSLIGTFTTRYEAGQPRVTNIRRMARTIDGTVIAPGAQFSLNGIVGERTKAGGYVEAPFISDGNKIEPSVGGGVSQFSTTMYNAAYFAGLKIDTHTPHSLYISRYPPGREATLNYDSIDLKWTNDTDAPIFVRAVTDEGSVTVSLYGDNGGRRVTARPGAREPVPGGDFRLKVVRTVRYPDGRSVDDAYTTTYTNAAEE